MNRSSICFMVAFVFTATSVSAETLSAGDAEDRWAIYFTSSALSSAIAAECNNLPKGVVGTYEGTTLTWHGKADVDESLSRAVAYGSAAELLKKKAMEFDTNTFNDMDAAEKAYGGLDGMVATDREKITSDVNHKGRPLLCAWMKYVVDSQAVPIVTEATILTH